MPEVPLFTKPSHPDAWRDVRAPGGYEWWYFDAEDAERDLRVVAILLDGFPFHPEYLRRHAAYLKRPTRNAPPQPREYPCAYLAIYEKGKIAAQFMTQFAPGSLRASTTHPEVALGANQMRLANGAYELEMAGQPWKLTAQGPKLLKNATLSAKLSFSPLTTHKPLERDFFSKEMTGATHDWILAQPHSRATAHLTLTGPNGKAWTLRGRGYHDHNFGTAPLGPGIRSWFWGRILTDEAAHVFHVPTPLGYPRSGVDTTITFSANNLGFTSMQSVFARTRRTVWGLAYPTEIRLGAKVFLEKPRVVDSSPFYLRANYAAIVDGVPATAFCEVAYPHRLRWPILGRMVGMSITRS